MTNLSIKLQDTWALLIGVGKFTDKDLPAIPAVTNNLAKLRELLANPAIVGIPPEPPKEHIVVIENQMDILQQITQQLPEHVETLFVYYIGHGIADIDQHLYLAVPNTLNRNSKTALPFVHLWEETSGRATNLIYILDCCLSGKALKTVTMLPNRNISVLTATLPNQNALAPKDEQYTAFTGLLIELLENGFGEEPTLTTTAIRKELEKRLPEELKKRLPSKNIHNPWGNDYSGTQEPLRIAYNRAYSQTGEKSNLSPKKTNKGQLLPYLINRDKQTTKLISAIKTIRKCPDNTAAGPLLCFIHSNEDQCSDTFLTRLEQELIPNSTSDKAGVASYRLNCNIDNLNDLHESIRISLAEALLSDKYAEVKVTEIIQKIAIYPFPVILYTHMYTQHWLDCEKDKLLDSFIRFWTDWKCSLASHQLLLVCVFFHYQENVKKNSWFHRLFKKKSVNQAIREMFENLAKENFLAKFSVPGVVLPELQDIRSVDVEEWARNYLPDCCHQLLPKLRQIFADIDKLPMEHVVDKVEPLLKNIINRT